MAEIILFHHVLGRTAAVEALAQRLRAGGHVVHVPDLFDGRVFDSIESGMEYAERVGLEPIIARGAAAAADLPAGIVCMGLSLGVLPAQQLVQTRPGVAGGVFVSSCVPADTFGAWPGEVPVQIHGEDADPFFAGEGDIYAARALADAHETVELFVYPGSKHLFLERGFADYDPDAADQALARVTTLLTRIDAAR
ncbi:dienelactone hydrolase family protein [Microbacterium kribbense]|uniref:Dienelactone hydrolase family protein n=1 Tax=Microbacterium kribbense TaxID=433645 RepID=A0ABP7G6T7_9MICO